ncbi:hypothetical protein ACIP6X_02175 [Streptomyces coeruleorubidus]|uniref:hypothetical protein n=1 Tax=Streptomyces coeruleorubidus TaxID=116188 RepID=UPI00381B42C5
MAIKTQTWHIAICDVTGCGAEFDETGDYRHWDTSPDAALDQIRGVEDDTDWRIVDEAVVCPISDTAHYLARGGESPTLLRPSRDAARYTAPSASDLIAESDAA